MIFTAEEHPGLRVFVDGVERFDCFYADTDAGIVRGYKQIGNDDNARDDASLETRPVDDALHDELIVVEYRGVVTVL